MNKILKAAQFAAEAHEGQVRKYTNEPYVRHPARVAGLVSLIPWATEDMICAAYLHDTIEDCDVSYHDDLVPQFGKSVADLVDHLTDAFDKETHPELNRKARKALELDRIVLIPVEAKAVKLADIIDNLNGTDPTDKFALVFVEEKRTLLDRFMADLPDEEIAKLTSLMTEAWKIGNKLFEDANAALDRRKAEKAAKAQELSTSRHPSPPAS